MISESTSKLKVSSFPDIAQSSGTFEIILPSSKREKSSSFTSKSILTSHLSKIKIIFSTPSFEKRTSAATSDLELFNSADCEEYIQACLPKDPNFSIGFEPFILTRSEFNMFEDNISTSSFLKELVTTSSDKINEKLDSNLILAAKGLIVSPSLRSKKMFVSTSEELCLE